jgi:hypothetical protein
MFYIEIYYDSATFGEGTMIPHPASHFDVNPYPDSAFQLKVHKNENFLASILNFALFHC